MARQSTRSQVAEPQQTSSPPATPAPSSRRSKRNHAAAVDSPQVKQEEPEATTPKPTSGRKRGRASVKAEEHDEELPHNLSGGLPSPETEQKPASKKRKANSKKTPVKQDPAEMDKIAQKAGLSDGSPKKKQNYKLTPGSSPYPTYEHPTAEECKEVVRLLSKAHGKVTKPKEIRAPSLTTAGCGEVPSVLDALIRTRLSAATTGTNSSRAFQSLVKTFGTISSGIGAGSVDWNAVRLASQQQVFEAIKCGGLAGAKSKDIKAILDSVHAENQERAAALRSSTTKAEGEDHESKTEQHREIQQAEQNRISLDHLHLLSNEDAFNKLVTYPGIGPKTASCVLLFCLQRPSFAVDTHVFRLCKYLGWVPSDARAKEEGWPRVERNTTYSHCEVRVPDEHKYGLHQLLIKHGKQCGRCRAATGMSSEGWKKGCPIEHLVKRHGAKKGMGTWDEDEEGGAGSGSESGGEAEMSDLGSVTEESSAGEESDNE